MSGRIRRLPARILQASLSSLRGAARRERLDTAYRNWDPRKVRAVGYMAPIIHRTDEGRRAERVLIALDLARLEELFRVARLRWPAKEVSWAEIQETETLAVPRDCTENSVIRMTTVSGST